MFEMVFELTKEQEATLDRLGFHVDDAVFSGRFDPDVIQVQIFDEYAVRVWAIYPDGTYYAEQRHFESGGWERV